MSHVFISYSKRNADYVNRLANYLQENGFDIWLDTSNLHDGVSWWQAIDQGIKDCTAFIVVMTPESAASKWVQKELHLALHRNKPLFQLLRDGENWSIFVDTQYTDVSQGELPNDEFLQSLSQASPRRNQAGQNQSALTPTTAPEFIEESTPFAMKTTIRKFFTAYGNADWDDALAFLGEIRASGLNPDPFNPDEFESEIQQKIEAANYLKNRDDQYDIVVQTRQYAPAELVWRTFQRYRMRYPHHDPENILESLREYLIQPDYSALNILPPPFAWIDVPTGKVKIVDAKTQGDWAQDGSSGGEFEVSAFKLAKYPVTVAQYAVFVEADGYTNADYWTKTGWQWREKENITQPAYWENEKWHVVNHPVIGISFYEAVAYANWLKMKTRLNIHLPTEQQWQRAALGDTHWTYPWGHEINETYGNYGRNIEQTTPVTDYLKGASPYGIMNMGGNVWEWTQTDWTSGANEDIENANRRVLRGSSWNFNLSINFRVSFRNWLNPHVRNINGGFRLALS